MRLNIPDHALSDPRFTRLGQRLGITRHAARGHCEPVWMRCYSLRTNLMDALDVDAVAEINGFGAAMVDASLARVVDGDTKLQLWICGVNAGMQWLLGQDRKRELALEAKRSRAMSRGTSPGNLPGEIPGEVPPQDQDQDQDQDQEHGSGADPDPALAIAAVAITEINRLAGTRYEVTSVQTVKDCKTLAKRQIAIADVPRVIAAKWAEWSKSDHMREQFKPSVLLRPSNFAKYREDLDARAPSQPRLSLPATGRVVLDLDEERQAS